MLARTSAIPHIPIPPMPTKWILVSCLRNIQSLVSRTRPTVETCRDRRAFLADYRASITAIGPAVTTCHPGHMVSGGHISIWRRRPERIMKPDPNLLIDVVASKVLDAWKAASEALARADIRHVVIGGLAVGANGHPRATKVVDFLVGGEAFHHHAGGLVTMNPAIPIAVNGVAIDYL